MKKKQGILMTLVLAAMLLLMGCGTSGEGAGSATESKGAAQAAVQESDPGDDPSAEHWAYIHDPSVEVLRIGEDGQAVYKGQKYKCEKDDTYITLTDDEGQTQKLRYEMKKDKMLLYETTVYHYVSGKSSDQLIGLWQGGEGDRLSYEFTEKGTYLEDGVFPGHYLLDEEKGTIKLAYNDHFEDTYLYYKLEDGKLTIEYPWPMIPVSQEAKPQE